MPLMALCCISVCGSVSIPFEPLNDNNFEEAWIPQCHICSFSALGNKMSDASICDVEATLAPGTVTWGNAKIATRPCFCRVQ